MEKLCIRGTNRVRPRRVSGGDSTCLRSRIWYHNSRRSRVHLVRQYSILIPADPEIGRRCKRPPIFPQPYSVGSNTVSYSESTQHKKSQLTADPLIVSHKTSSCNSSAAHYKESRASALTTKTPKNYDLLSLWGIGAPGMRLIEFARGGGGW